MAVDFKVIVIGRGMMGAAAARHLSGMIDGIALIGPGEPSDRKNHQGVFASHYDEACITRTFDDNMVWATLADRSLDRYADIEARSGISFFSEVGCLFAGPKPRAGEGYLGRALDVAGVLDLDVETLDPATLRGRFPQFNIDGSFHGFFQERRAGHINPRALVRAQSTLAQAGGVEVIDATVTGVRDVGSYVEVEVEVGGKTYSAERILVAAGGFTNFNSLLPEPVDVRVAARTVVFFELGERELETFGSMPAAIVFGETDDDHVYILPPVPYPDGKTYLKLGGDTEAQVFETLESAGEWFRSEGNPSERDIIAATAQTLMPGLAGCPISSASCVATFTRTAYPYAGFTASSRIAVLTGGNFVAAKSSDEIGRLGAVLMTDGVLGPENFGEQLTPVMRASHGR
ncbi:FAD-binding oxidoreductase [Rhizobium grahamii]|uniref:FAD-binding oxidoreductase n=1 Tax=Rhizobium grahamii TaxID=1120045 RepID=A0A5Q0C9F3_9HYPH|nr:MULTISPECIES: FAD-binding oxidoreductase [Rhizobium]QFY60610.1 FAD-binding oxidoreductase [Rhizobium grahamii]QRM50258.1 FAD-binding oxidoreductase [Rhizobium sp. BG6]